MDGWMQVACGERTEPATGVKTPGWHVVQEAWPIIPWYMPAGQSLQPPAPSAAVPGGHTVWAGGGG